MIYSRKSDRREDFVLKGLINMNDKDNLLVLKNFIHKKLHFRIDQYKDRYIERRLNARMNLTHVKSINEYIELLKNDQDELNKLRDALTINVTEFFRNPQTFDILEKNVIPQIIKNKELDSTDVIKIWSAGCSSGEETYTLAILFLEVLRKSQKKFKVSIRGTDIDRQSILTAKAGKYDGNKVKSIRKDLVDRYFQQIEDDYQIKPFVKQHIIFSYLDLTDINKKVAIYDLILCRNVIIYFKENMKKELIEDIYNVLRKNGFFIQGKNESLIGEAKDHFVTVNLSERIYSKVNNNTLH